VHAGRRAFGSPAGTGPLAAELDRLWRAKGRASAALRGMGCGHGVAGWRAPPRGAARLRPAARLTVMDLLPGQQDPPVGGDGAVLDPLRQVIWGFSRP
jgi:hypothetical protein